ncbi:hypothetical protein ACXYRQ_00865 [Mycoplasma sp. 394]
MKKSVRKILVSGGSLLPLITTSAAISCSYRKVNDEKIKVGGTDKQTPSKNDKISPVQSVLDLQKKIRTENNEFFNNNLTKYKAYDKAKNEGRDQSDLDKILSASEVKRFESLVRNFSQAVRSQSKKNFDNLSFFNEYHPAIYFQKENEYISLLNKNELNKKHDFYRLSTSKDEASVNEYKKYEAIKENFQKIGTLSNIDDIVFNNLNSYQVGRIKEYAQLVANTSLENLLHNNNVYYYFTDNYARNIDAYSFNLDSILKKVYLINWFMPNSENVRNSHRPIALFISVPKSENYQLFDKDNEMVRNKTFFVTNWSRYDELTSDNL